MKTMPFSERVWQRIPGWDGGEIFPVIIRPGIVCSNTYLIDSERAMIVIDPGTDPAQYELIDRTLAARPGADDKPLLVLLTHCHHDHSHGADRLRVPARAPNLLLAEASGAKALREGNRDRTLAFLYPDDPAVCLRPADAELFAEGEDGERLLFSGPAGELRLSPAHAPGDGLPLCHALSVGASDRLLIYRTPGHTPCSISVQAGELLFVGDLPFAADPGLIGLDGWHQGDLLASFDAVDRLMAQRGIRYCLAGHGAPMRAEIMRDTLARMQEEARSLALVDAMDSSRIALLKDFAGELLDEAEYLFAVISGRLYAVAHHLNSLEEEAAAQRFAEAIDLEKIERTLTAFRSFHEEFRAAGQPTLTLIMKGVQTARSIERIFDAPKLHALLDQTLIRRASRLLSDYVALARGMRFSGAEPTLDVGELLGQVVDGLDIGKLDGDAFIESSNDAGAYLQGLVARLAFPPAFRNVRVRYAPRVREVAVAMSPDRLGDMVMTLLESIAAAGAGEIVVRCDETPDRIAIHLSGGVVIEALAPRRVDLSRRVLAPLGGSLRHLRSDRDGDAFAIELPKLGLPMFLPHDAAATH